MIRFKQFVTEARMAPLYHGTNIAEHKVKWVAEHIKAFHDTNLWLEATRR